MMVSAAAVTLMIVFAALAFYANAQRTQAEQQRLEAERRGRIAQSRQLAANAMHRVDRELDVALLLGVEAARAADTFESRSALFTGLTRHAAAFLHGHTASITSLAFSADDARLASGGGDGSIALWDVSARTLIRTLKAGRTIDAVPEPPNILALAFSSDAGRLLAVTDEGSIQSWGLSSHDERPAVEPVNAMTELVAGVTAATFNRDGSRVAIGSEVAP